MDMKSAVAKYCTAINEPVPTLFKVCFRDDKGLTYRWMRFNGERVEFVHHARDASEFTRDEVNTLLLALWNAGEWELQLNSSGQQRRVAIPNVVRVEFVL